MELKRVYAIVKDYVLYFKGDVPKGGFNYGVRIDHPDIVISKLSNDYPELLVELDQDKEELDVLDTLRHAFTEHIDKNALSAAAGVHFNISVYWGKSSCGTRASVPSY